MDCPFEIVFNDEYVVVVNKIAKILVEAAPGEEKNTLTSFLCEELKERVYPCHRLDRQTSGLVIFAKTPQIQEKITNQFRDRLIQKKYFAFVRGNLKPSRGSMEGDIIDKQGLKFRERPKYAKTLYKVLKNFGTFSFVDLKPLTGRTHQLRIQLSQAGSPILGERQYAFGKDFKLNFRRLALHAYFVSFFHPVSGRKVQLSIPMPADMQDFLSRHDNHHKKAGRVAAWHKDARLQKGGASKQ